MNIRRSFRRPAAWSLIETLVYISVLAILLGLGFSALYHGMDSSIGLRRNAEDITRAVKQGEIWREDVRAAETVRVERPSAGPILHLTGGGRTVSYRFLENTISRRVGQGDWLPVLSQVRTADFVADTRPHVQVWRWELELQPRRKTLTRIPPLFTFIAVPTGRPSP